MLASVLYGARDVCVVQVPDATTSLRDKLVGYRAMDGRASLQGLLRP